MPASIFNGSSVKILKDSLKFKSGTRIFITTVDPSSVATEGEPGDVIINTTTELLYVKKDSGSSTNWDFLVDDASLSSSLANYILNSEKGANSGVATLDAGGKLTASQIPAIAITDTFVVASQAAQTALTAEVGDVAVRTDENKSYILVTSPASTFGNWQELLTPTGSVSSVFGRTGAITAEDGDYTALQITNVPDGGLTSTTVQEAIDELKFISDGKATSSELSTHEADTTNIHGITNTADLLTTTNTKVVTNKDIDGGTASDTSRLTIPKNSTANFSPLTRKEATLTFSTDEDRVYQDDGSNLSALSLREFENVNLIRYGDAESPSFGGLYNANNFTAGAKPSGSLLGTPAGLSFTRSSTSPLSRTYSYTFDKDGVNRQGQCYTIDFTVQPAYRAKVLQIEFDYIVNTGTFVAGSSTTNSDVIVYVLDSTNNTLIEPSSFKLLSNSTTIADKFVANFQTSATGSAYKLLLYVSSTSTAAYNLKLDNIAVKPCSYVYGTPITDWQSYTPTWTASSVNPAIGNGTITGKWRRVGDSAEINFNILTGTTTTYGTGFYLVSIPSGFTIDVNKNARGAIGDDSGFLGQWTALQAAVTRYNGQLRIAASDPSKMFMAVERTAGGAGTYSTANEQITNLIPVTWAGAGNNFSGTISVPISGWSSSTQVSDGYDGRAIVARATRSSNQAIPASTSTTILFNSVDRDTTNSYNSSTGIFTVPTSGDYRISTTLTFEANSTNGREVFLRVDGVSVVALSYIYNPSAIGGAVLTGTTNYPLRAGQTVQIVVFQNSGISLNITGGSINNYLSIEKLQAPTTISATEVVAASYRISADKTPSVSNPIDYDTKIFDTHNAVTTGSAWKFTAPVQGLYRVTTTNATSTTGGTLDLYKNGSQDRGMMSMADTAVRSSSATVELLAGGYISINPDSASKTFTGTKNNTIYIERIK